MVTIFNKSEGNSDFDSGLQPVVPSSYIQLEALRKISQISNDAPSFELALMRVLEVVGQTLGVERVFLMTFDPETNYLTPHLAAYGFSTEEVIRLEQVHIEDTQPNLALVSFRLGFPVFSNDCTSDQRCNQRQVADLNIHTQLILPIQSERRLQGVCVALNKLDGLFVKADLELFETLAVPLANLLKNFNLVKRLENQQRRHLAVLDAAVDGFIEVDRNFKITLFNKGAENLTGWSADDALGRTCSEVLQPHSPDGTLLCHTCPLKRSFRYGLSVSNVETLIHTNDGEDNWTSCSYNSVVNEAGGVMSGVIAIKDIYRLKALGDELQLQIQQQQSLLGVINAINGLSNIEEIYHRSLDEVRKAIHFDVGTIHAIEADGKTLRLVSHYEVVDGQLDANEGEDELEPDTSMDLLGTLNDELDKSGTRHTAEYHALEEAMRQRQNDGSYQFSQHMDVNEGHISTFKSVSSCEALCQNEPYMAVNLPGKPVCPVLSDFSGLQSHICVPIKTQDFTYGVLHLAARRPYAFWGSDFGLAYNICKQIAVAAERASLFEKIDRMARTDALTNLYNKLEFWDRIGKELKRAERHSQPLSLIMIDLDRLKWFNEYYGHVYGDLLLKAVAQVIIQKSRTTDIAFRFGGDELCLLLPATTPEEARLVAERIRIATAHVSVLPSEDVIGAESMVTMSVGISSYPSDAHTAHDLFLCADAAEYRAKNTGKNRVCIYNHEIDNKNLTSRRRNPSDYETYDERLKLPVYDPTLLGGTNENNSVTTTTTTVTPHLKGTTSSTETLGYTMFKDEDFDADTKNQFDIEILPDPSDPQ
jgi:diguanylate cyclase (GGDEF)-like protein/PAS domain S-box-containing protein